MRMPMSDATPEELEAMTEAQVRAIADDSSDRARERLPGAQLVVAVMCGGGVLGNFAACQPADFYIDDRARTPYPAEQIMHAVTVLAALANRAGLDPYNLPAIDIPRHSFGLL
jgi:hypothetical protein